MAKCEDCGLQYVDFQLDTTIPDDQWNMIHSNDEGGILCANCMVVRASRLNGIIAARMIFEFKNEEGVEAMTPKQIQEFNRMLEALKTISKYMTPEQIRIFSDGLEYEEALERSYENAIIEAKTAAQGIRWIKE